MEKDISRKIDLLNILIEEKRWFTLFELEKISIVPVKL